MSKLGWLIILLIIGAIAYYGGFINSSMFDPNYVSVKNLAMGSNHEGYVVSEGFVGSGGYTYTSVGVAIESFYLVNQEYKVQIKGNLPPTRLDSCSGIMSYPYYRVIGTVYKIPASSQIESDGLMIINYTLLSCKNV